MITKRAGVWGPQQAATARISIKKLDSGEYEASANAGQFVAKSLDENKAARMVKEAMEKEIRSGK